jgi:general secretion pathway protein G
MHRKGFTLIELMLVVIIIGVLASMVAPRLFGRSEQAKVAAAKADVNSSIALALDLYELDNGKYPDSLEDLLRKASQPDTWKGPYLKKKPLDPWGREYSYRKGGAQGEFTLCSKGPDEESTEDDICSEPLE